jgi:hypothetical protein
VAGDGAVLEFGTRGGFTNDEAGVRIGHLFYGTKGWDFIDAIRAGDPRRLTCDVLEGHLSSALPHLGNISYRVATR